MAPARLAQSVERETLNLKVAGSTPASGSIPDASLITVGASFFFLHYFFVVWMPFGKLFIAYTFNLKAFDVCTIKLCTLKTATVN